MADWQKIQAEYITGDLGLQALAKKYGVTEGSLYARARKEAWFREKQACRAQLAQKAFDPVAEEEARRAAKVVAVADKLLQKVEALVDTGEIIPAATLKTLSDVLKNIKSAQMLRTPEDIAEQQAKIAKLRLEEQKTGEDKSVTVTMEEGVDAYAG